MLSLQRSPKSQEKYLSVYQTHYKYHINPYQLMKENMDCYTAGLKEKFYVCFHWLFKTTFKNIL